MNKLFFYILPVFFIMICCKVEPETRRPWQTINTPSIIVSEDEKIYISYINSKTGDLNIFKKHNGLWIKNIVLNSQESCSSSGRISGIYIQNDTPVIFSEGNSDNLYRSTLDGENSWNTKILNYEFTGNDPLFVALWKLSCSNPFFMSDEESIFIYSYNYAGQISDVMLYLFNPYNETNLLTLPSIPFSLIKAVYDEFSESQEGYLNIKPFYFNGEWDRKSFLINLKRGTDGSTISSIYYAAFSNGQWTLNKITLPAEHDFNGSVSYLTKGGKIFTTIERTMLIHVSADGIPRTENLDEIYCSIFKKIEQSTIASLPKPLFESQLFSDCIDNSGRVHAIVDENSDEFVYDIYYHVYDPASSTPLVPVERVFLERMEW